MPPESDVTDVADGTSAHSQPPAEGTPHSDLPLADPHALLEPLLESPPADAPTIVPVTRESVDILNRRIWAFALDYFIVLVVQAGIASGAAMTYLALGGEPTAETPLLDGIVLALGVIVLYGYFFYMEGRFSTTFGKRVFGLRVVNRAGEPITWGQAFVRNVGRFVDLWLFGIVGLLFAGFSRYRQRIGDRMARTYVVDSRPTGRID